MLRRHWISWIFVMCLMGLASAQSELAATLEVLNAGVSVQRVNTTEFLPIKLEAIVGVGDTIRTDATGKARVTFFADGTDTELAPNTEYRILRFEGDATRFNIRVEVLIGQTRQRLERLLDSQSSYEVQTPAISLVARGTEFSIRVEANQRSAMLVSDGVVSANAAASSADVAFGFGVRADSQAMLSDVVRASTFEELDSALDGCSATLSTPDDTSLNIRQGAGRDYPRIGTLDALSITNLIGVSEGGDWYRIAFRDGFGWFLSTSARIDEDCVGLRRFANNYGPEDPSLYSSLGDNVLPEDLQTLSPPAESTSAP
jgi:uncharacterized protein YraI